MRDDVPGLVSLKSQFLPGPAPSAPRPATRPQSTSFLSQLNRATNARASAQSLKKYDSPLARSATANQAQQTTHARAKATTTTTAQPRPTLAASPKQPTTPNARTAPMPAQRSTGTTPKLTPKPPTSLTQTPASLTSVPRQAAPSTSLTAVGQPPATFGYGSAQPLQSPTSSGLHPADWPRLDAAPTGSALGLDAYPRPVQDNGRGMHWIPTTQQSPATVDRFVAEAQRMGVKWVTFLNDGANVGANDYLASKLSAAGIEPVMRIYSPTLQPLSGDIEGMVRHYTALGVHYFQPFNEPNLNCENPDGKVSVDRYLDAWVPAAKAIERAGGLAGFGALAPGGDYDDQQFLKASLDGLKARGELGTLDKGWISMHNYTWNHPIADRGDGDGFFKFRAYQASVRAALGRDLPIVGTEGGTFEGQQEDPKMPAVSAAMAADWTSQAFKYMRDQREPWLFASSVWTIANGAGGADDSRFEAQALFKSNGARSSIVGALQNLG